MDIAKYLDTEKGRRAYTVYGENFIMEHFCEECAELYAALSHKLRKDRGEENVLEEMCDVVILLDQLSSIVKIDDCLPKNYTKEEFSYETAKTLKKCIVNVLYAVENKTTFPKKHIKNILKILANSVDETAFQKMYEKKMKKTIRMLNEYVNKNE